MLFDKVSRHCLSYQFSNRKLFNVILFCLCLPPSLSPGARWVLSTYRVVWCAKSLKPRFLSCFFARHKSPQLCRFRQHALMLCTPWWWPHPVGRYCMRRLNNYLVWILRERSLGVHDLYGRPALSEPQLPWHVSLRHNLSLIASYLWPWVHFSTIAAS